jgi:topoisomerase-4 subunit A
LRGGRACKIAPDKKTLVITQIPFSTTTTLIDSILKANEKGKIKIKKIEDNTAADVEILIHLFQEFLQIKQLISLLSRPVKHP